MTVIPSVQWHGAIAQSRNAINASGGDGGGRVLFDIPDTEASAISGLLALRGKELVITVMAVGDLAILDDEDEALPFDEAPTYQDTVRGPWPL